MDKQRPNILFVTPSLRRAGAETQVIALANGLDTQHFRKHLLSFGPELHQRDRIDTNSVRFHHFLRRRKLDFSLARQVAELIDKEQIDIVHCTLQISLFVVRMALRYSTRKPAIVAALHTTLNRSAREELMDRFVFRRMIARSEGVVFVCRAQARHWERRFPELAGRTTVIYNGVDCDALAPGPDNSAGGSALRQSLGIPAAAVVLACVAGFRDEKGHSFLIDAFTRLTGEPWLLLAGDGPMRSDIERRIREAGVAGRVRMLGEVDDIRTVLAASDITVLASTAVETFSMAMLESMAMAVPVVATDIGGLAEAIRPGETGDLVPPCNASALAVALQPLILEPQTRAELGGNARTVVVNEFSLRAMVEQTATLLSRLAAERGA